MYSQCPLPHFHGAAKTRFLGHLIRMHKKVGVVSEVLWVGFGSDYPKNKAKPEFRVYDLSGFA
jgi:hypothetical protein